jgi:hypothetical protein
MNVHRYGYVCVVHMCLGLLNFIQIKALQKFMSFFFLAILNASPDHQPVNEDICEIINGKLKWDSITLVAFIYRRLYTPKI